MAYTYTQAAYLYTGAAPPAYPSAYSATGAANLTDLLPGDTSTGVTADNAADTTKGPALAVVCDLGASVPLQGIVTLTAFGTDTASGVTDQWPVVLSYSADGTTWTDFYDGGGSGTGSGSYVTNHGAGTFTAHLAGLGVSARYLRLKLAGASPASPRPISLTVSDFRVIGADGTSPRQIPAGSSLTFYPDANYTAGTGGWDGVHAATAGGITPGTTTWIIDNDSTAVIAQSGAPSAGWTVVPDSGGSGQYTVTVPSGATIGRRYALYYLVSGSNYRVGLFDVVAATGSSTLSVGEPTGALHKDGVLLAIAQFPVGEPTGTLTRDGVHLAGQFAAVGEPAGAAFGADAVSLTQHPAEAAPIGEQGLGSDAVGMPTVLITVGEQGLGRDQISVQTPGTYFVPLPLAEQGLGRDAVTVIKHADTTPPPPVTGLRVTATRSGGADIAWDAISPAVAPDLDHYNVRVNGGAPSAVAAPTATRTLTGLTDGALTTVEVSAVDVSGNESPTRSLILIATPTTAPGLPSAVVATPTPGGVLLTWNAAAAVAGVSVRRYDISLGGGLLASVPAGATSAAAYSKQINFLAPGVPVTLAVQTVAASGAVSAPVSATPSPVTPLVPAQGGSMTGTQLGNILDNLALGYLVLKGDGVHWGDGNADPNPANDYGFSKAVRATVGEVLVTEDETVVQTLLGTMITLRQSAGYSALVYARLGAPVRALTQLALNLKITGVSDLASLLAFFNTGTGGPWACLLPSSFGALYTIIYPSSTALPAASTFYADPGTNLGAFTVGGAFSAGTTLGSASVAGAAVANLVVGGFAGAGGTVTVTGTARLASGATATGRTFTAAITGNGTVALTPLTAGDLLLSVSGITAPGGMTAGTLSVVTAVPAGRTFPAP